jgi:hypothetical protein
MTQTPILISASIVFACIVMPLAIGAMFYRGAIAAGLEPRLAGRLSWTTALALAGWLAITFIAAGTGLYATDPWLGIAVIVPLVLGLLVLRLPVVTAALSNVHAVAALAAIQVLRVAGGAFLVMLALDRLPAGFALPAGLGDVLVGLLALPVAYALWRRPNRRPIAITFNVVGLLDLVVAIPLGLLYAPGQLQLIVTDPTTAAMGLLPLALVPTYIVPLAIVLHIASLRLLAVTDQNPPASRRVTPTPSAISHRVAP